MARQLRREAESGIHHVMNRGVDHQAIFFDDGGRVDFGQRLTTIHERYGVTTLAYCLMDNHFHLLLRTPEPGALSMAMHHIASVYTRHTNDLLGRDGPLLRGRFHSIPVETDSYLLRATRYIHRNPLDLPEVTELRRYRWSSYRTYLLMRQAPPFLDMDPVMRLLGGRVDDLIAMTEDHHPPGSSASATASITDVRCIVRCGLAVADLIQVGAPGEQPATVRTLMTLLAARTDDPHLRRLLLAELGPRSHRAEQQAVARALRRLEADPTLQRALIWTEAELAFAPRRFAA